MPQALLYAAAIAAQAGASSLIVGALAVGGLVMGYNSQQRAKRKAREQFNAAQVDRLANVSTTTGPRELVLGRVRKGGNVFFRASTGVNNATFIMCVALAGHEIDGVEQIYLNDQAVTLDGSGNVQEHPYNLPRRENGSAVADASGTVVLPFAPIGGAVTAFTGTTAGPEGDIEQQLATVVGLTVTTAPNARITYQYFSYHSKANIRVVTGAADQLADVRMVSLLPSIWTAAHRAQSVAYLVCEFQYDETAFPSGLPAVTAVLRGARLYDPRTASTIWSDNPALMMRYVYAHPNFGKGAPSAAEDARISAAATACDNSHDYVVDGVTTAAPLYRAALVVPFGTAAKDVFDDLTQAMAGAWAYAGGELHIKAGVWSASAMALTEADLADVVRTGASEQDIAIAIVVHREQAQKFNTVNATIYDSAQGYKQTPLTPLVGAALLARDGKTLAQAVDMQAVGYAPQALHVAGVLLRDARDPLTVTLAFKLNAYPLELFDTVALSIPHYGWSGKLFVVMGRDWTADGNLSLTLKETAEAIYTPDADFSAQGYAANTQLPSPWFVPDLGALAVTSGTDELLKLGDGSILTRMRVAWAAVADAGVIDGGTIEVQYRSVLSDGAWSRAEVSGAETQLLITDVQDGGWYTVRARAKTRTATGVWCEQAVHQVVGKTEPPPAFDRFLVLAQPDGTRQLNFGYTTTPAPVDWLGAQIRYLAGTHASPDWSAMAVLSDSATHYTASPVEVNAPSAGTYTFACRSVDTSGNLAPYLLHTITLPDRRLGSVFDEFDERDAGWAGVLSGCYVNADGDIEASNTSNWATGPSTWATWGAWNYAPTSPITYETPAQDLGATITGQIGSTVDADGATLVELATSPDGSSWSSWGSASGPFSARHVKLRLTVTATGPAPVALVRQFQWLVDAPLLTEYINDADISALSGSYRIGTGDVRVPLTLSLTVLKHLQVTIQDSSAGTWSWQLIDKTLTYGPRVQFKLAGTLADPAFVDFYIEGF